MQGTIELRGAKQVLNAGGELYSVSEPCFIPGDIALYDRGVTTLVSRQEQRVIAVGQPNGTLYILNFGPTCPYRPKGTGERLVLDLHSDGTYTIVKSYTNDPKYDVNCLLDLYRCPPRPPVPTTMGSPLYTKEFTNHNDLATFTIDPTHSVDFDDAISVDVETNTVYIHIVDIANQTLSNTSLERLRSECLSLYLSNEHTEHLLDTHEAAFDLSLVVGEERPVITVKVVLDEGCVSSYDIYRSTIIVKQRFDYETVKTAFALGVATPAMVYLAELTKKRNTAVRYLTLPSVRILSDYETGEVTSVTLEDTNDVAHSLVATAMILANLTVSKHLTCPLPNRFHETLRGMQIPAEFVSTGNPIVDSFILVKRYARACYAVDKKGHFGLGITDYVHFTSPMRRYADVLVHRILAGHQFDLEGEVSWLNKRASLVKAAQDIYLGWKKHRWLKTLPNPHTIWVTGVSKAGIMWFMPSLSLNGFIHVSVLEPKQYWVHDGDTLRGNEATISVGDCRLAILDRIEAGEIYLRLDTSANERG